MHRDDEIRNLDKDWRESPRWTGVQRPYTAEKVLRLRGNYRIEHTIATLGAKRLWDLIQSRPFVRALGALTGNQAVQQIQAGLEAVVPVGWQVAGDANSAGQMYPDQSLYPSTAFRQSSSGSTMHCVVRTR